MAGLTFLFVGRLDRWTREEVQRHVEQLGVRALNCPVLSSGLQMLLTGTGPAAATYLANYCLQQRYSTG